VGVDIYIYIDIFLTSALAGDELSASSRGLFNPRGKNPRYPCDRRLGGPHSRSGPHGEAKIHDTTGT
jgi:hypothetical protein